jgi:hypothetical protein
MQDTIVARHRLSVLTRWLLLLGAVLLMPVASARAEIVPWEIEGPRNPHGFYGGCIPGGNAGVARKSGQIGPGGYTLDRVIDITVIDCHQFDGPGGGKIVPCPPGTSYTYCITNMNDGLGNHIEVGVTESATDRTCLLAKKRPGPPAQMDIVFQDQTNGLETIELRGPVTNARSQPYVISSDRTLIVITFTKINQALAANVPNILVTNGIGAVKTCAFSF